MRAWLLLLIVLATFQTIVQVASTEDPSERKPPTEQQPKQQQQQQIKQSRKTQTVEKDLVAVVGSSWSPSSAVDATAVAIHKNNLPANRRNREIRDNREIRKTPFKENQVRNSNANTNSEEIPYRNYAKDPFTNLTINMQNILENHIAGYHKHKHNHKHKQRKRLQKVKEQQVPERSLLEYQTIDDSSGVSFEEASFGREKIQPDYMQHLQQQRIRLYPRHHRHHRNYHSAHHPSHLHLQHIELENKSKHQPTAISQSLTADPIPANSQPSSQPSNESPQSKQKTHHSKHKRKPNAAGAAEDDGRTVNTKQKLNPAVRDEIKNGLLSLLKMDRPPEIDRSKIVIPEIMTKLYAQKMRQDWNYIVRSFTHKPSRIDERFPHHHRFRLYFDVSSIPAEEKLKAAELQLFREIIQHSILHPRLANRTRYQVLVYDILRLGIKSKRPPKFLLLDNKPVWLNSTEMISLDVRHAVDRWLASPKNNHGLLVEVRMPRSLKPAQHHHVRLRRSADEEDQAWRHKQPFLITYTDNGHHKSRSIRDVTTRSKRAGHSRKSKRRKNHEEICQRRPLYVDFSEVGWSDWIVAPPGYDAFYCQGKCPFPLPDHLNSTNHAVVQTIANDIHPGKVPHACCVPTQLEGHSFLYLNDENTVVLKNYEDMAVVGCGCR